jgi:hypothetical protein
MMAAVPQLVGGFNFAKNPRFSDKIEVYSAGGFLSRLKQAGFGPKKI